MDNPAIVENDKTTTQLKRVLVTISISFSIRYLLRSGLLNRLTNFCTPVVGITWDQPDLVDELRAAGFEVVSIPESVWGVRYARVRRMIDVFFNRNQLKSPTRKIEATYLQQFMPFKVRMIRRLREWYYTALFSMPGGIGRIFKKEKQLVITDSNYVELEKLVSGLHIDAVFTVTPFHRQEDVLLRVCKNKGLHMMTAILSFDNITKRGWIPIIYDAYMVWNAFNAAELKRAYPPTANRQVSITGAPQFDFYYHPGYCISREEWLAALGIRNTGVKIILYAGGPGRLVPQELQYVKTLADAIQNDVICKDTILIFRCHPIDDVNRWKQALSEYANVVVQSSWTGKQRYGNANITDDDIRMLCSTLAYTDVHVNFCSTMSVDGCAFRKPQIAPCYDERKSSRNKLLRSLYLQEHFRPVIDAGGIAIANSSLELIALVNDALLNPDKYTSKSQQVLRSVISFTDGNATNRVVEAIKSSLEAVVC